jgi:hypothetical protein
MKNKWDKLKPDFFSLEAINEEANRTGWDRGTCVIDMDDEWWKKAKAVSLENDSFLQFISFVTLFILLVTMVAFLCISGYSWLWQV